nr:hypothetical protein [Desulfopila aestuarii]
MRDQIALLEKAGFSEVQFVGTTGTKTSDYTVGALFCALAAK